VNKIGVCIATCDRPEYLTQCVQSLQANCNFLRIVIIDNGSTRKAETKKKVNYFNCDYIDGNQGNSPEAQNIGLDHLSNLNCEYVLKSDDDIVYQRDYINQLMKYAIDENVCAVGGVCWSNYRKEKIEFISGAWRIEGKNEDMAGQNQFAMWRTNKHYLVEVNFLHGGFIYKVSDALKMREKTLKIRGGAFGEYFSKVAFREETEFSLLLKHFSKKKMLYATKAISFHHYAPGGIRMHNNQGKLEAEDHQKVIEVFQKYDLPKKLPSAFERVIVL